MSVQIPLTEDGKQDFQSGHLEVMNHIALTGHLAFKVSHEDRKNKKRDAP